MKKPLSQNRSHLQCLTDRLKLGSTSETPLRVFGGFHHRMWRLETNRGTFAIKQLSSDSDLDNRELIDHYNVTEFIAETFSNLGIPAIFALKWYDQYLQRVDNTGYLVYPWTDSLALEQHCIAEKHALEVARIMATIHRAKITVPELGDTEFDTHSAENITELVLCTKAFHGELSDQLERQLPIFLDIVASQGAALQVLGKNMVVSHGDLDHKNVLWSASGRPTLIDWESARRLNPTYEILLEAIDWGSVTSRFELSLFEKMLAAYNEAGGCIESGSLQAAFDCVLADWVNWLMYNVGRSIDPEDMEQRAIGADQVKLSLVTISRLQGLAGDLLSIANRQADGSCSI